MRRSPRLRHRTRTALPLLLLAATACHVLDLRPRYGEGEIDIYDDLFAVSVPDQQHAVAVGYHGTIFRSEDGGDTWSKGETPSDRLLYAVSMADSRHGWAVGQLGTILRTEDGGRTWTAQPNLKVDEGSHLFDVQATGPRRAWVVGEWGTRVLTEDGGVTWTDHSLTLDMLHPLYVWLSESDQQKIRRGEKVYEDVGLTAISCLPAPSRMCWIIGEFGYVFWSDDSGESWQRGEIVGATSLEPIEFRFNEIEILDEYRGAIAEFAASVVDQAFLNVKIEPYVTDAEIRALVRPDDPTELFDVISARVAEMTSILEDAGLLLDRLRVPNKPPWDYEDFLQDDPEFLERYIEGRRGPRSVLAASIIQNPYLFTVDFADEQNGLISGLGGVILRSSDGGRTWRYGETDRPQAFFSVAHADGRAVAVGEKGLVRESRDGGLTWSELGEGRFPPLFTFMRDLAFDRRGRVGFIVGQEGLVLRTTDAGSRWDPVLPPPHRRAGA